MSLLSDKQKESILNCHARLNIWEGSVRSGKTFASIVAFLQAIISGPPGQALICGVSREAIQRNVMPDLCGLLGVQLPTSKSNQMQILGRTINIVGANDERAQGKIKGATLIYAYCDEITELPESFFTMLLSRLSVAGARLFGTTNPDNPYHWFKVKYLDRTDLDMNRWKFKLPDNPSLPESYVENLKKEYAGLWHKRLIEGEWCLADGTVYDIFDEEEHVIDGPPGVAQSYHVGVDYGTTNPTAFLLVGYNPRLFPNLWVESEYYYDSVKEMARKVDSDYAQDMQDWLPMMPPEGIYIDPAAASLQEELRRAGVANVLHADNDVINGIQRVTTLLANGTLKICRNCVNTIREIQSYTWDSKASDRGEDKPKKAHDHCFTADTKVLTLFGEKPISEIKKGEYVWTRTGWNPVIKTWHSVEPKEVFTYSIVDHQLTATPNHPVITEGREVPISKLNRNHVIYVLNKHTNKNDKEKIILNAVPAKVSSKDAGKQIVYNLTVANSPEYLANGVLVHNCLDALRYVIFTRFGVAVEADISSHDLEKSYRRAMGKSLIMPKVFQQPGFPR